MKKDFVLLFILALILFLGYFMFLGSYPLLDVDETRYVDMARSMLQSGNFLTLYLNGDYFFEKPPLYFWIECVAFKMFGGVNELTARLPIVLLSLLPLGLLFGLCKKIKNIRYAFITCAVLLTSLEYILITKIAILDSVLTSFVTSAVLCYFYTFFTDNKKKKYFWCLTYIFTGLAVMAKGIPGFVIPFGTIAVSTIVFKTYRETLKYSVFGILLFFVIVLPWHILMLKTYPGLFFEEYIYKHHILRFLGSDVIDRKQPWYFYFMVLLWGMMPHTFVILAKLFSGVKFVKPVITDNYSKFLTLNIIAFLLTFIFFSVSGTKLITYILPVYPFLAVIVSNIWLEYIEKDNNKIRIMLLCINFLLILAAMVFPFAAYALLNDEAGNLYLIQIGLTVISYFLIVSILKNHRFNTFILQTVFIAFLVGAFGPVGYKMDYFFGQDDLMHYAQLAKANNFTISTYAMGKKYSLLYYSGLKHIEFKRSGLTWLNNELSKKDHLVITKNKKIVDMPVKIKIKGRKYSVIEKE